VNKESNLSGKERKRIIDRVIDVIDTKERFLMLGHVHPDEDCISSMVAFALLLSKCSKKASICITEKIHEHYEYLLDICRYNGIEIIDDCGDFSSSFDVVTICDTPKPSMIAVPGSRKTLFKSTHMIRIEIDHHMGADGEYSGDEGYRLVTAASSASELVGLIAMRLKMKPAFLKKYQIDELFTRNFVLAILTGVIGDSKMGAYLKTREERRNYRKFSLMYSRLLEKKTSKEANFKTSDEVFSELGRLSNLESICFSYLNDRKKQTDYISYVALDVNDMNFLLKSCDYDTIVSTTRTLTDRLAEDSKYLGLVVYYDDIERSNLIQFKLRRSSGFKDYDLRNILPLFSIENGGGHEGAIGFRFERSRIENLEAYIQKLILGIEKELKTVLV
jgi:nanoRNase/pAp phosphatase (c-di-AMP/oligoRNAs hydrolase)